MIKGIGLENFKAFQHFAYIDFKKINVFLGPNSSGKSSYLKGLLTLQNTMMSKEDQPALHLNDRMGDFSSIVYGSNVDAKVSYTFVFGDEDHQKSDVYNFNYIRHQMMHGFSSLATAGFFFLGMVLLAVQKKSFQNNKLEETNATVQPDKYLEAYKKYVNNKVIEIKISIDEPFIRNPNRIEYMKIVFKNQDVYEIILQNGSYLIYFNEALLSQPKDLLVPYKFFLRINENYPELVETINEEDLAHIAALSMAMFEFEKSVKDLTDDMIHIEPFRNEPKRSEMISNYTFSSVGSKGENMLAGIIDLNNSDVAKNQEKAELLSEINYWMNEFQLAESIDFEELGNNNYSLLIENKYTKIQSNIVDVGVGTSQLLPIIIESVLSPRNSTLLIEEPETHIHPNAQAKLGELFVSCSQKYDKQFFIETHSMYLLIQLQILVAKKQLKPEDIGVYYFIQDEDGTHIKDLRLQENGQFAEDFPDGFFDVPYKLTTILMENM